MKKGKILGLIITLLIIFAFVAFVASGPSDDPAGESQPNETTAPTAAAERVLLDNEYVKISYEKIFESEGVDGVVYLQLHYQNKTDKDILVLLDKSSVNGEMLPTLSGIPTTIAAGKESRNPVFYNFPSAEEVENIEFEVVVCKDDTMEEMFRSQQIRIDI